jgi:hypothetical protein
LPFSYQAILCHDRPAIASCWGAGGAARSLVTVPLVTVPMVSENIGTFRALAGQTGGNAGMINTVNPVAIFLPMLVVVALTFVGFVRMAGARAAAVKSGHPAAYYKAQLGAPEPEATVVAVRHYGNLFELPVLFYAGCLTAFSLNAVTGWTLAWAWGYVAARVVQSVIHMSYNNPSHRGGAFVLGVLFMLLLWITIALAVFSRL